MQTLVRIETLREIFWFIAKNLIKFEHLFLASEKLLFLRINRKAKNKTNMSQFRVVFPTVWVLGIKQSCPSWKLSAGRARTTAN